MGASKKSYGKRAPKVFRDPIHGQIRFTRPQSEKKLTEILANDQDRELSGLLLKLIDTPEFQRLRHIRQNGLANYAFHGLEHSRFSHSLGVAYTAREMFDSVCHNSELSLADDDNLRHRRLVVCVAALLHDTGHGPFSHTIEDVLNYGREENDPNAFHHEEMTRRYLTSRDSKVGKILNRLGKNFVQEVIELIELPKEFIPPVEKQDVGWTYRIVSSQLDADRLDYLQRDSFHAGIKGHGFDFVRMLDMLRCSPTHRLAVDIRGLEAVEAYLMMYDHLWRVVYYHHSNRAASFMLTSVLRRFKANGLKFLKKFMDPNLATLLTKGKDVDLGAYSRVADFNVWSSLYRIASSNCNDTVLVSLVNNLLQRSMLKTRDLPAIKGIPLPEKDDYLKQRMELLMQAKKECVKTLKIREEDAEYFVAEDKPEKAPYKPWDINREEGAEAAPNSIWILDGEGKEVPFEDLPRNRTWARGYFAASRRYDRLIMPEQVRAKLSA